MRQEEKELLLKDLCARLPYGIFIMNEGGDNVVYTEYYHPNIDKCKPYLRPMSSMTEDEIKEYKHLVAFSGSPNGAANFIDWLNKKMFAYRTIDGKDIFELGLALKAPEGMYKFD